MRLSATGSHMHVHCTGWQWRTGWPRWQIASRCRALQLAARLRDMICNLCHSVLCNTIEQIHTACTRIHVCPIRLHKSLCTTPRAAPARTTLATSAACVCACNPLSLAICSIYSRKTSSSALTTRTQTHTHHIYAHMYTLTLLLTSTTKTWILNIGFQTRLTFLTNVSMLHTAV